MSNSHDRSILFTLGSAIVATGGLSATSLIYFYENYRIPLKALETKIEQKDIEKSYQEALDSVKSLKEKNLKLEAKTNELEQTISQKSILIDELQNSNLFYPNSFYPQGFGRVQIGESIESLRTIYKQEDLNWRESADGDPQVVVQTPSSFFKTVEYTYDDKTKKIETITFQAEFTRDDFLLRKLSDIGGPPEPSKGLDAFRWKLSGGVHAYLVSPYIYMIMIDRYSPIVWRARR
ncbi:hypothetical protein PI739_14565 [Pseudomonas cerasi]|uniref:hypothetical protein n=1 Tax=Pseudomonas cerasi TaxID=1583341 RepID=UPI002300984D|nr:hypothetical protein [Pseudomonas cerasi]MDA7013585.1 hypothetical protein [Pseudomonas cerasi]